MATTSVSTLQSIRNPFIYKLFILTGLLFLLIQITFAQESSKKDTLVGLVLGRNGRAIQNAQFWYRNRLEIVRTDKKGIFIIVENVLPDSLNLLLPSKKIIKIPIMGKSFIKIITNENNFSVSESKDEILNIGYGKERKSNSISGGFSVSGDQLRETGERNIILAIAGKVPGLNLVYKDGSPTLMIRGGSTLEGNNDPLYILDGSIVDDLSGVNINDVARVDVLKDGSIYGTRGANGVILITTKDQN